MKKNIRLVIHDTEEEQVFSDPRKAESVYKSLIRDYKVSVQIFKNGVWKDIPGHKIVENMREE